MFISEALTAGNRIWVVSPWITDVSLIDNRSGNFDALNPEWGRREVKATEVLTFLMTGGRHVTVVTRNVEINKGFIAVINEQARRLGLEGNLSIILRDVLHSKGIVLSRSMLVGSMNLTYSGVELNDESVEFVIDPEDIARTRLECDAYLNRVA
jgi:phosphatidylserine/phosphatidylglycerophosphate/cardiolipin synthase-like enzyme